MDNIKPYTTKNGAQQFKPSAALLQELDDNGMGFCLACGEPAEGVEPDARCPESLRRGRACADGTLLLTTSPPQGGFSFCLCTSHLGLTDLRGDVPSLFFVFFEHHTSGVYSTSLALPYDFTSGGLGRRAAALHVTCQVVERGAARYAI